MNLKMALIHLYPRRWRDRYEEEFAALLADCAISPLDVLDIVLGALDARLHLPSGDQFSGSLIHMLKTLRTTMLVVFCSYVAFVLAGLSFYGMVDDSPFAPLMGVRPGLAAAWTIVEFGSVVALLGIAVGGLPLGLNVLRQAISTRRNLLLVAVPILSMMVLGLFVVFTVSVAQGWIAVPGIARVVTPGQPLPPGNRVLIAAARLLFLAAAAASTAAICIAVVRSQVEEHTIRFTFVPAVITTLAMALMLGGTLWWGVAARAAAPDVFTGPWDSLGANAETWWLGIVGLMALSTLAAAVGVIRGIPARTPASGAS